MLGIAPQLASRWENYFREHPEQVVDAEEAKTTLLAPMDVVCDFSVAEYQCLKERIISSIKE